MWLILNKISRFMSEKIKMKMETPIKEEYLDSDLPSRSEKGKF